jgi:excisionase family DNA binding protein
MEVKVSMPEEFNNELSHQIYVAAESAFKEIKRKADYPDYMTIKQACSYIGVSRTTLMTKLIPAGLKMITIDGSLMRFSKKTIDEFLEQHNN